MKIIFLEAVQNLGGSKRSVIDMAEQLSKAGHQVLIVDFWGAHKGFRKAVEEKGIEFDVLCPESEAFVIRKGGLVTKGLRIIQYMYNRMSYKKNFNRISRTFKPDYVCVNSFKTLDILTNKSIYKIDYFVRGWSIEKSIKSRLYFLKYNLRFIAISEATRQAMHVQHGIPLSEIRVVKASIGSVPATGGNLKVSREFGLNNPIQLLHAGTFVKTKGHHITLIVAKALKDKGIHFKLKIAGLISVSDSSKHYYNELIKMLNDLNLSHEVEFIVNNNNLNEEMKKTDVFINPSYSEGLSRVCLEAMYHGKPVITNPAGGVTDFVIDNYSGALVNFNDIASFVESITRYYENPLILECHSTNAINIANSGYLTGNLKRALDNVYPN